MQPEVRLVNRKLPEPGDVKLFPQEAGPEGCASGECLTGQETKAPAAVIPPAPPPELYDNDEPEPEFVAPPPPRPAAAVARPTSTSDEDKWRRAVDALRQESPRHGKSLSYARFLGFNADGSVRISFPADAQFHRAQVTGLSRNMVEAVFAKVLGRPTRLVEDNDAAALQAAPKSIAEVEQSDRNARERAIEDKVKTHPALRNIVRHLGGGLEHISYLEPAARQPTLGPTDEGDAGPPVD